MRSVRYCFEFAAVCSIILSLTAIILAIPVLPDRSAISRESRHTSNLMNVTSSTLGVLPANVEVEWEAATGMAAGVFSDFDGWRLSLDYICRVAIAYPVTDEVMTPRALASQAGGFEIYVSGWPAGRLVNVGLVMVGLIDTLWQMGHHNRYQYGRWYLLLDNERRGFIEFREIQHRETDASAIEPPFWTTPTLQDVGFSTTYGHQIIPTAFFFYGVFLQILLTAISQGLDTPNYGSITHMAPLVDVWLNVKWTPHFTNRHLIELVGYISRIPLPAPEDRFRNMRTIMYGQSPRGPRELASLTVGQPITA